MSFGPQADAPGASVQQAGTLARVEGAPHSSPRARTGWIAFAGVYLLVAGAMNAVWGSRRSPIARCWSSALAWANLTTWGWVSAGVAAIQLAAGGLVLARRSSAACSRS